MLIEDPGLVYYGGEATLKKALSDKRKAHELHGSEIVSLGKDDQMLSSLVLPPRSPLTKALNYGIVKLEELGIAGHIKPEEHVTNPPSEAALQQLKFNDLILLAVLYGTTILIVILILCCECALKQKAQT